MSVYKVCVVRTGLANLASVLAGFRRAGADPFVTENPAEVESATHVVLPGVGSFGPAMKHLDECGLTPVLKERLAGGRPTFCVCLGLQLLHEASEESPGVAGLGVIHSTIRRLPNTVRVPQLGWNSVEPVPGCKYIQAGHAYFANSYCAPVPGEGWLPAYTEHGVKFVAAMEKGALLACQLHPELSGEWGLGLIKRWITLSPKEAITSC